jgi:hypothetical protein
LTAPDRGSRWDAGTSPGIAGPGNGERERGSRGRRSAAPGTYQTVCGELIPTTNRPGAAGPRPRRRGADLLTRALPRCRHRPIGHPDRVRRPRHRSSTGQMTGGRSREAGTSRVGQPATVPPRAPRSQRKPSGPSLSQWTHENGSPSRLPITHHARRDPTLTQPDDPHRPLGPRLHPARRRNRSRSLRLAVTGAVHRSGSACHAALRPLWPV